MKNREKAKIKNREKREKAKIVKNLKKLKS